MPRSTGRSGGISSSSQSYAGALSATLTVVDREEHPLWDLRVDHRVQPVEELRGLHVDLSGQLLPLMALLPPREDPLGEAARRQLEG